MMYLKYRYNFKEYIIAQMLLMYTNRKTKIIFLIIFLFIFFRDFLRIFVNKTTSDLLVTTVGFSFDLIVLLVINSLVGFIFVTLGFYFFVLLITIVVSRLQFNKRNNLEIEVSISSKNIKIKKGGLSFDCLWEEVKRVIDLRRYYIFNMKNDNLVFIIPKWGFPKSEDLKKFGQIIKEKNLV